MGNYSQHAGDVRIDRFKPRGKWYDTWSVDMEGYYNQDAGRASGELLPPTWEAVYLAIMDELQRVNSGKNKSDSELRESFERWTWVCLEPYHFQTYPIMFVGKDWERQT